MLDLIAQGTHIDQRWRRRIPTDDVVLLGRTTPSFRVPWDDRVSRSHVELRWADGSLWVEKVPTASNPVFHGGTEKEKFRLEAGDHFVIGNTTFTLTREQALATHDLPNPIRQKTFSPEFLRQIHFRDADQRMDVLSRLPELISTAGNEQDLYNGLSNTLLAGILAASTVGIVKVPSQQVSLAGNLTDRVPDKIEVIHWDRRGALAGDFQPSEKLIHQAIDSGETVLHIWQQSREVNPDFTCDLENDWAFVCPLDSSATPGWGIYVTGTNQRLGNIQRLPKTDFTRDPAIDSDAEDLQGDIKFCELVSSTLKNLLQVQRLERRQASLRGFFSPIVLEAIAARDPDEVLAPQECRVSVMFCDLRGFSKTSEKMGDELFRLLNRVSQSLDVMTHWILNQGGVIGDFHGDSAMGFWGWPLKQTDTAGRAIQAAVDIKREFRSQALSEQDFQIGIGIATGTAVAGKIGSRDQVKVTVFGPVVNLASRLEGMNKLLGTSVLLDRATVDQLGRGKLKAFVGIRPLGRFQPYGLTSTVEVFQLLADQDASPLADRARFKSGLAQFQAGQWAAAKATFDSLTVADSVAEFFVDFMGQNGFQPAADFNGIVELKSK